MSLIDECKKLRELEQKYKITPYDGNLEVYSLHLREHGSAMLEVLGCHEEYDSAVLKAMKSVLIGAGVQGGSPMMNVLDRHIRAAALMEQEGQG